ncbi:MAG TPA: M20/M25/M40 family metallo-hydrolase [Thermoanaerobaculia bacterium]|nr:M20/M25/M40 family metallo-hydrolase [Thermoanaerobaculia bacterium]
MTGLSRGARRAILYGSAAVIVALVYFLSPRVPQVEKVPDFVTFEEIERAEKQPPAKMLAEYLRIDTTDPPGHTREAAEFLGRAFACEGIPYSIVGDDPESPIFVARLKGRESGNALLLLHHMDVVPAEHVESWKRPPFSGAMGTKVDRKYLYGRGAIDMKGWGVAAFFAMAKLVREGVVPRHDIVYVGEPGEELFSAAQGVGWLMTHRPDLLEGVTDALNEGGVNEALTSRIERFEIEVMQKATVSLAVDAPDVAPLEALADFLKKKDKEIPYRLVPSVAEYLKFIGPSRGDIWGRLFFNPEKIFTSAHFRDYAPELYRAYVKDSIYVAPPAKTETGGFTLRVSWGLLPGSPVKTARETLEGWIRERGLKSRVLWVSEDSVEVPRSGPLWDVLTTVLSLDREKAEVGPVVLTVFYTNSSYLRAHGIHAYGFSPFNINIMDAAKAHADNERINVVNLVEGTERFSNVLLEWATR